ncbi:MAG: hypothetical protein JKY37_25120, partial [Nannocystaceae bacterium]|nr:hypothetical protein [Nannocystaceae bacterium]
MIPWVVLYAVTGWLFNHPTAFSGDAQLRQFSLDELPETQRSLPTAQAAAEAVTQQLAAHAPTATITVVDPESAQLQRRISAKATRGTEQARLSIDIDKAQGALRLAPLDKEQIPSALLDAQIVAIAGFDQAAFDGAVALAASELGQSSKGWTVTGMPRLRFTLRVDGEDWRVTYQPKSGAIDYERLATREVSVKRVLARLHMTHGYPERFGAAWLHTFIVDLVVACLMLWCITGALMWWQMRRFRRIGLVVIGSALAASLWVL